MSNQQNVVVESLKNVLMYLFLIAAAIGYIFFMKSGGWHVFGFALMVLSGMLMALAIVSWLYKAYATRELKRARNNSGLAKRRYHASRLYDQPDNDSEE